MAQSLLPEPEGGPTRCWRSGAWNLRHKAPAPGTASAAELPARAHLRDDFFKDQQTGWTIRLPAGAGALKLEAGDVEQLAVYTLGGNLYLAGNNPRGCL